MKKQIKKIQESKFSKVIIISFNDEGLQIVTENNPSKIEIIGALEYFKNKFVTDSKI